MVTSKTSFYGLYRKVDSERIQLLLMASQRCLINQSQLFEMASEVSCEQILTPSGATVQEADDFFIQAFEKKYQCQIWLMEQKDYNEEIVKVSHIKDVHKLFILKGELYPLHLKKKNLKKRFLNF